MATVHPAVYQLSRVKAVLSDPMDRRCWYEVSATGAKRECSRWHQRSAEHNTAIWVAKFGS